MILGFNLTLQAQPSLAINDGIISMCTIRNRHQFVDTAKLSTIHYIKRDITYLAPQVLTLTMSNCKFHILLYIHVQPVSNHRDSNVL